MINKRFIETTRGEGVMAVSSGNQGAGVSYAAHIFGGLRAKIFLPVTTPQPKLDKIEYYDAELIKVRKNLMGQLLLSYNYGKINF